MVASKGQADRQTHHFSLTAPLHLLAVIVHYFTPYSVLLLLSLFLSMHFAYNKGSAKSKLQLQ